MTATIVALVALACVVYPPPPAQAEPAVFHVPAGKTISQAELMADLKPAQVIFLGEYHDNEANHVAQYQIIRTLHEAGVPLTIAVEMFRSDSQEILDKWSRDELGEGLFVKAFEQNWGDWPKYRAIFRFARDKQVPLLGLNLDRAIVQQIEERGFASLTPEQVGAIGALYCNVDPSYEEVVRRSLMFRGKPGAPSFIFFCEAQLVGDSFMAKQLVSYRARQPDRTVIVLAGPTHAWKHGIPRRVTEASPISYRVVLPEMTGRLSRANITDKETDYLWIGL
ncbi:MAG: ChaN family lipoprotein [Thermodesulfobacteriota bacterium]